MEVKWKSFVNVVERVASRSRRSHVYCTISVQVRLGSAWLYRYHCQLQHPTCLSIPLMSAVDAEVCRSYLKGCRRVVVRLIVNFWKKSRNFERLIVEDISRQGRKIMYLPFFFSASAFIVQWRRLEEDCTSAWWDLPSVPTSSANLTPWKQMRDPHVSFINKHQRLENQLSAIASTFFH